MSISKKVLAISVFAFSILYINAQENDSADGFKTLLGANVTHGGYGAFSVGYTKIGNYNSFTGGMKGVWIINHSIGIGIAGNGFITEKLDGFILDENYSFITGGYGGFLIEPIFYAKKPVHFSVPIIIGGGAVTYITEMHMNNNGYYYPDIFDEFFVFEPGIELELNMVKFFRVALGLSYRLTSEIDLSTGIDGENIKLLDKKAMNQLVIKLAFKFGKF
jgi:hypothetical protein